MKHVILVITFLSLTSIHLTAIVKYDEGRLQIDGVQLLQDHLDPNAYYYLPQYPRLAQREDGTFEFLCLKYVGGGGTETNGGLFHALIEFSLDEELLQNVEAKLKKDFPNARIVGPVPMKENMKDGEEGQASFEVVSSIFNNTEGDNAFTQSYITSGHAPLLPGSRSAIAAKLNQQGATLLWASFEGNTSDVSIALSGYYEAVVKGYNAIIEAEVSTVYEHFSQVYNAQEGFTRQQLRDISNELVQEQVFKVEVFDRSASLDIDADDMQGIVDLVTNKLIELMFDPTNGWSKVPEQTVAVEQNQIPGRQSRGEFVKWFGGTGNQPYTTDYQFVIKRTEDVRVNKFYLNLSRSSTIKVPFFTTGNLQGFYGLHKDNDQYFRIVNTEEPAFQSREVIFQLDGNFTEAFSEILNFVQVSFKKEYSNGQPAVTREILINGGDLLNGTNLKSVTYPALGLSGDDLINYDYRVSWSFKGAEKSINLPSNPNLWLKAKESAIALVPPFDKRVVEIDVDRSTFAEAGIKSASIRFFTILKGEAQVQKTVVFRDTDPENTSTVALYYDNQQPVAYQVNWYPLKTSEVIEGEVTQLADDFLFLIPPTR